MNLKLRISMTFLSWSQLKVVLLVLLFLSVSVTLATIPAETIINLLGSNNALILMFVLGSLGGLTTFSGIPYHLVLMSLASGGLNPILLGIVTALGVMVGDSTMFLLSKKVEHVLPLSIHHVLGKVSLWLKKWPALLTPLLVLYGALSPFSNDFIVASLSLLRYTYRRIIIPLAVGNILFNIGLAYIGIYGYDWLTNIF